jgi:hypothetical protein
MNIDSDTKRFIIHRLKWLAFFTGIGFILVLLLPFPLDFISVTGLFVLTYYLRSRNETKRLGDTGGIRDLFGSFFSVFADQNRSLKYYCIGCGKEHRETACPNCGSKMKRVG